MTTFLKRTLILVNILIVLSLIMVKMGSSVNPNTWILPSYFAFFLFPLAFANFLFLLFWAMLRKWWFLLPLVAMLLFWGNIKSAFPINFSEKKIKDSGKKITVLSYNTMTTGSMKTHSDHKINPVVQYILDSDADIVCLQEFAVSDNDGQFEEKDFNKYFKKYPFRHIK